MSTKTEVVKETVLPPLPSDLEVGGMLTELFSSKVSYNRKQYIVETCMDKAVTGVKQNFLLMGFLADYGINKDGPHFYHTSPHCEETFLEFVRIKFQVEKSTIYAAMKCFQNFCTKSEKTGFALKPEYQDFSQSQLVEMLPLSVDQRKNVKPYMTVKYIRELKKSLLPPKPKMAEDVYGSGSKLLKELGIVKDISSDAEFSGRLETPDQEPKEPIVVEAKQPAMSSQMVVLTNEKQRKEWLHDYQKWGVWMDVPALEMKYYRYDFGNGDYVIVTEQTVPVDKFYKDGKIIYYSLVKPNGYPSFFKPGGNAQSLITDYLQETKIPVMKF